MVSPTSWDVFLRLHSAGDCRRVDSASYGADEALAALLSEFDPERLPDQDSMECRFRNLCTNRRAKHRQRARLYSVWSASRGTSRSLDHIEVIAIRELLALAKAEISALDWHILVKLAEGYSCGEIASSCGLTATNVKSRACRSRKKVRNSRVGTVIWTALEG